MVRIWFIYCDKALRAKLKVLLCFCHFPNEQQLWNIAAKLSFQNHHRSRVVMVAAGEEDVTIIPSENQRNLAGNNRRPK